MSTFIITNKSTAVSYNNNSRYIIVGCEKIDIETVELCKNFNQTQWGNI